MAPGGLVFRALPGDAEEPVVEVAWIGDRAGLRWRYADGIEFQTRADGAEVWATWPAPMTLADAAVYLVGPVLGYVLRRRGVLSLHASAVVIGDRAVAFCGEAGAGKSTLAATFASAGYPVVTDDVLALGGVESIPVAQPAGDHLRVWDDSAAFLVGEPDDLPLITPDWEKRALPIEARGLSVMRSPVALGAIFLSEPRAADDALPRVGPARGADALMRLAANTTANYLLDGAMRVEELRLLEALVARTRLFLLRPHSDPRRLAALVMQVEQAMHG